MDCDCVPQHHTAHVTDTIYPSDSCQGIALLASGVHLRAQRRCPVECPCTDYRSELLEHFRGSCAPIDNPTFIFHFRCVGICLLCCTCTVYICGTGSHLTLHCCPLPHSICLSSFLIPSLRLPILSDLLRAFFTDLQKCSNSLHKHI